MRSSVETARSLRNPETRRTSSYSFKVVKICKGPVPVSDIAFKTPLSDQFLKAGQYAGISLVTYSVIEEMSSWTQHCNLGMKTKF